MHDIIKDAEAKGWATQLHNEPGLILNYERAFKIIQPRSFLGGVFDVEPHYGFAVGNVYDYVNAGAMARFGFNLPKDYGPMRIQPSLPGSDYSSPPRDWAPMSLPAWMAAPSRATCTWTETPSRPAAACRR